MENIIKKLIFLVYTGGMIWFVLTVMDNEDIQIWIQQSEDLISRMGESMRLIDRYNKKLELNPHNQQSIDIMNKIINESIMYNSQSVKVLNALDKTPITKDQFDKVKKTVDENLEKLISYVSTTKKIMTNPPAISEQTRLIPITNIDQLIYDEKLQHISNMEKELYYIKNIGENVNSNVISQSPMIDTASANVKTSESALTIPRSVKPFICCIAIFIGTVMTMIISPLLLLLGIGFFT